MIIFVEFRLLRLVSVRLGRNQDASFKIKTFQRSHAGVVEEKIL
jgi:hypothetical protein